MLSIQNTSNASANDFYVFVVDIDNRSNKNSFSLNGDVSKYVIAYNGTNFVSYGQFTGLTGPTGPAGPAGTGSDGSGATGPTGAAGL